MDNAPTLKIASLASEQEKIPKTTTSIQCSTGVSSQSSNTRNIHESRLKRKKHNLLYANNTPVNSETPKQRRGNSKRLGN